VVSRETEARAVDEFLASVSSGPAALIIEGEAGIGKTTAWVGAQERAQELGFRVLSTRAAPAESVLAFSSLDPLLDGLDEFVFAELPPPQRLAIDRVLLRVSDDGPITDQRAVAVAVLSVLERLAEDFPVLVAIDDLQWLDLPSAQVVSSVARRLHGSIGVLATVRTGLDIDEPKASLPKLAEVQRIRVGPLTLGGLRAVISERLGRRLPRAAMVRIHEESGGNPFYALELVRMMDDRTMRTAAQLPGSLAELVRARVGGFLPEVWTVLLAASCVSAPTVELIANATGYNVEHVVGLLGEPEENGIVDIDGHRVCFTHPLLARGVYSQASAGQRREMHRKLADVVEEPELQARHLALAVAWGDSHTLECLDKAAESAAMRGAPSAAAELLDLAVGLGGDTAERRIRLASYHFAAGDSVRARALLDETIASLPAGRLRAEALRLLGPVRIFDDSFLEGVAAMELALVEAPDDLAARVPTLVTLLLPLFNTGQLAEAAERAQGAVADAERLGEPLMLSQALSLRVFLGFLRGHDVDESSLRSALEMEDRYSGKAIRSGFQMIVRPRSHYAILLGWTGQLDRAHEEFVSLRQSCIDHGLENELIYIIYYNVQVEIWRGDFTEATLLVEQGVERALQLGGEVSVGAAMTWRAALAAYAGDEQRVRCDVSDAVAAMRRCGAHMLEGWPIAILGFLELSLGSYKAALATLEPLLSDLDMAPEGTEIYLAECLPDAIEAMVHLGRLEHAEPLVDRLERNGRRLDRAWMLAVAGRCRGMIQGARGDLEAAILCGQEAMRQHARIPMPFERARTQLVLGQLERRRRHREAAITQLRSALETFEQLGAPLWAQRARAELERTDVLNTHADKLTVSEQRVAELAASGMTNREVASALFISPKTVEVNLVRMVVTVAPGALAEPVVTAAPVAPAAVVVTVQLAVTVATVVTVATQRQSPAPPPQAPAASPVKRGPVALAVPRGRRRG
jgi:tetratricopeptide (TPR) repeat protein